MNRREFMTMSGAALVGTALGGCNLGREAKGTGMAGITWHRNEVSKLFDGVSVQGQSLIYPQEKVGLFDGFCSLMEEGKPGLETMLDVEKPKGSCGPVQMRLTHQLLRSAKGAKEDILAATLTLKNDGYQSCELYCGFLTGVRPTADPVEQMVYIPLSGAGLGDPDNAPNARLKDCRQNVGNEAFLCHYLETPASDPFRTATRAALLAPVVDIFSGTNPCHVALFGPSTEPIFFEARQGISARAWRMGTRVVLKPGESKAVKAFLLLHEGDAARAWDVFHRFGHTEDFPGVAWTHDVRVHYFDFLGGVEPDGPRGGGYDLDLQHFGEFQVGMATQHGYYLSYGDFVHPDRKEWQAMPTDAAGPVTMTLEKIKARVEATRKAGVRPAIYMHYGILDEGSPLFEGMRDSIRMDKEGNPISFGWKGPDIIKQSWRMSQNAKQWRDHLVQQAHWIMELFNPDAIVFDETFHSWGWDYHKEHGGRLSAGGIELMRQLRKTVRSFGPDKALFASDCSMSNFCLWGDGEAGDHCYEGLAGHELYRKPPVRYMAALGKKAWLPCAWMYKSLWPAQVDLARKTGAAVGVTNGWGDNLGLTHLPPEVKEQMLRDINSLVKG